MATKPLTHDEKKAAEAAFRGLPFDSGWSTAARVIYDGIMTSAQGREIIPDPELAEVLQKVSQLPVSGKMPGSSPVTQAEATTAAPTTRKVEDVTETSEHSGVTATLGAMTREQAVHAGLLVDVTASARQVGITLPVSLTKPVWETGITAGDQISEDQQQARVRDLMLALRLFLEQTTITSPLMQFPALLSFPPEDVPQVCPLFVLTHKETATSATPYALTVLLPREVSVIKVLPQN